MHFLLTNDDGIHAPGLAALEQAVALLPGSTWTVVAPSRERSQCGHSLTTREPLVLTRDSEHRYHVDGTPADCVRVALFGLNVKPDFVLSGVNAGGNMGQDIHVSGTVAGVREAAYHGLPAAAFSHYLLANLAVDWTRTARWAAHVLGELLEEHLHDGELWNVNFPHLPPGEIAMPERRTVPPCRPPLKVSYHIEEHDSERRSLHYNARYAERPAEAGSDVAVCFGGGIAVSRLRV